MPSHNSHSFVNKNKLPMPCCLAACWATLLYAVQMDGTTSTSTSWVSKWVPTGAASTSTSATHAPAHTCGLHPKRTQTHQPTLPVLADYVDSCVPRTAACSTHSTDAAVCCVSARAAADANSGYERLAVVGEDSARQDRRYTYKALDGVGGFCFENGKAVSRKSGPHLVCRLRNKHTHVGLALWTADRGDSQQSLRCRVQCMLVALCLTQPWCLCHACVPSQPDLQVHAPDCKCLLVWCRPACVVHRAQVADWLDFVTGRSSAPQNQMRRERPPPERKNKGNGRKKAGAGATSDREGVGYEELLQQGTGNRVSLF